MLKNLLIVLSVIIFTSSAVDHEFWLEPDRFFLATGDTLHLSFKAGGDFIGESWKGKEIQRLEWYSAKKVTTLGQSAKNSSTDPVSIAIASPGTHLLVMETQPDFVTRNADEFNVYLEDQALDEIIANRKKNQSTDEDATEIYSLHAKLLVQAGPQTDDTYKKNGNLPLEIIPEKNPYALKKGDVIRFRILFEGKPLFGSKIKVWNRYNHRTSVQNIFSQQDGRIETHISNPGAWMVSVVKMMPSKDPGAKWRSYRGSLVFGVK